MNVFRVCSINPLLIMSMAPGRRCRASYPSACPLALCAKCRVKAAALGPRGDTLAKEEQHELLGTRWCCYHPAPHVWETYGPGDVGEAGVCLSNFI